MQPPLTATCLQKGCRGWHARLQRHEAFWRRRCVRLWGGGCTAGAGAPGVGGPWRRAFLRRRRLLGGCVLCFTSLSSANRGWCERAAAAMGATVLPHGARIGPGCGLTHCVADGAGSGRQYEAQRIRGAAMVTSAWLRRCAESGARVAAEGEHLLPLLAGLHISVTGMPLQEREAVRKLVSRHGGSFHEGLVLHKRDSRGVAVGTTHLLAATTSGRKYEAAMAPGSGCKVVRPRWLHDTIWASSLRDHDAPQYAFHAPSVWSHQGGVRGTYRRYGSRTYRGPLGTG